MHVSKVSIVPERVARIISVALEMRNLIKAPLESSLQAKKSIKLKGVIDRSLHFNAARMRSSILMIVRGSKTKAAPSTYKSSNIQDKAFMMMIMITMTKECVEKLRWMISTSQITMIIPEDQEKKELGFLPSSKPRTSNPQIIAVTPTHSLAVKIRIQKKLSMHI